MARIKFLIFAVLAIALAVWNMMSAPGPAAPAPSHASAPAPVTSLDGPGGAVKALLDSRNAWERAAAQTVVTSEPLASALAAAAKNGGTPAAESAGPLKAAADQAISGFPEAARHYVVVALAMATGALASVPGHDPLTAASFPWIDAALKAGPNGYPADVAGKKVVVYAAPVRAVVKDEVKELGSVAIAFSREPADWTPFVEASPVPFTLVAGQKAVASSDKAHADAVAGVTAAGPSTFKGGNAFAVAVPGFDGAFAVVTASAPAAAVSAPAAPAADTSMNGKIQLGALVVLTIIFLGLIGGDPTPVTEAAIAPPPAQVRVDDAALRASLPKPAAPAPQAPAPLPAPAPAPAAPAPVVAAPAPAPVEAPAPVHTAKMGTATASAPPPLPAKSAPAPAADKMGSFDDLFGPQNAVAAEPAAIPMPASTPAAPAAHADPLGFLQGGATAPTPETTGAMSRAQIQSLAAQSAMPEAIPLPSTSSAPSSAAIPLPASAAPDPFALASEHSAPAPENHERTVVAAVPQELLRAAGQRGVAAGANGPGVAGPLAATANAEELHFQDVYREFLQVRERCGEPQENLTFEKFSAKLRKNKEQLVQKYACKSVRFQVYVKEGKAALKATPVKEA